MFNQIKSIFKFRALLFALLIRGFKAKYKNSFLGIFWSFLNPLLNVLIFSLVFGVIIKIGIKDYPLYLVCAILPWSFFNSALTNSVVSIVEDSQFVKNVCMPLEVIPLSVVLVNLANFIIELLVLLALLFFLGRPINPGWFYLLPLIAIEFILTSAIAVFSAGAFVAFRDLNFILNFALRLFFYFVPVVYTLDFIPKFWRRVYLLNPMAVVIDGFGKVLFYGTAPDMKWVGFSLLESVIISILLFSWFNALRRNIPERL